jgi:uroporphyrinogen-III decarboxylase
MMVEGKENMPGGYGVQRMTGKERIIATLKGEKTDRIPIWLRDQFNYGSEFRIRNEKILDVLLLDDFTDSWVNSDANMQAIIKHHRKFSGDIIREFVVPNKVCNRLLCIPPTRIVPTWTQIDGNQKHCRFEVPTPKGVLTMVTSCERDISTMWNSKYLVENEDDIKKLLSIPYELEPIDDTIYREEEAILGDRGVMMMQIDTPIITVSGLMKFEEFLVMCLEDQVLLRELCDIAFERIMGVVEKCLEQGMGTLFRLNGSEQTTPPMNSPDIYEKFVYPYEKKLIAKIHEYGKFAAVHSHGKISRNLPLMVDMELDMLDPIEPPPAGDLEFEEAQVISQSKITLAGNIQYSELESAEPSTIDMQVRMLLEGKRKDHIILNATASPITFVSDRLRDNYIAMIDAGIKYGSMEE